MIELNRLTIKTRHSILCNVDYCFFDRHIYGIVAENGSGKTTLFRTLVDLRRAQSGTVLFDKYPMYKKSKEVFYYESNEWLDKNLSGIEYLNFVKNMWKSKIDIAEVIKVWDIGEFIKIPIKKYSLGMKQRLLISMYYISDANYLIMDEITNGLDEENRIRFFKQIQLLKEKGKTILLSSHYKDEIISYCDTVLQIKDNSLQEISL